MSAPVSVVIPCYRCSDTIAAAVASVAAQTMLPSEVFLVDDCSGDGTLEVLHSVAASYPPGWVSVVPLRENAGPSRARNAGWERATQEYVAFLDSDDSWMPEKIALQMRALREDPGIALIGHEIAIVDRNVNIPIKPPVRTRIVRRYWLMLQNPFPTSSVVLRRDLTFRFDERYRRVEDFLLWAQILLSGHRCAKINQVLAAMHKPAYGAGGLTQDMSAMESAGREVRLELLQQGLVTRTEHYITRTLGIFRKARRRMVVATRSRRSDHGFPRGEGGV